MFCPEKTFSFDDIGIQPLDCSEIENRSEINTYSNFYDIKLKLPIVSAPMEKATGLDLAIKLNDIDGLAFLPRTNNFNEDYNIFKRTFDYKNKDIVFVSIPAKEEGLKRFDVLYEYGARHFCIDVANGHSKIVKDIIKKIRKYKDVFIVTGNIASVFGYGFLSDLGVDGIRVGIGSGGACTTSLKTSIGIGQATLIREVAQFRAKHFSSSSSPGSLIIADGGIRSASDIIKSIALGADCVMSGKLFAQCKESPGNVIVFNDKKYKLYAGQASYVIKKNDKNIEGAETLIEYTGSVDKLFQQIDEGLRSSMSYLNCKTIEELRHLPDEYFRLLSPAAKIERGIHVNMV